ncbi:alpha/beta hydrolase [Dictyobacter formicarum]|uniref:Xaa-Pro dipeptidyl-peptidase-like domain-containing protein n=1 Tax=Dictyobacter formicarum TaxID=2778368 RepID=A0ABQ3VAR8_9CHLR|nr:CocE/NonD family hydrolase [Dictyobacter formicarum]GHO82854.1 hypothetical protein KSZ_08600 [Dictyobacter formicarum]
MHGPSILRTYAISICMVFVITIAWCIRTVYVSPANSAANTLKQATQVQARSQLSESTLQAEMHNTGNSSTLNSSTKSELFQLTGALRPGQSQPIPDAKDVQDIPVFDVSFYNERGNLISGWLAISSPHAPVIILTHGTPGDRVDMVKRAAFLFKHGYTVLLFDFQSYGKSQGVMSTLGMVESGDILAAIAFLHSYPDTLDSKIGVLGLSMGATAAVLAAARSTDISALIAESCPVDATRVPGDVPNDQVRNADRQLVEEVYGVDITLARPIDVVDKLSGRTAIFFINGDIDSQTPLGGMNALYNAAGNPKQSWVVNGAGHAQSFSVDPVDYETRVDQFFDAYLG